MDVLKEQGKRFADLSADFGAAATEFSSKVTECETSWGTDSVKIVKTLLDGYKPVSAAIQKVLPRLEVELGEIGKKLTQTANEYAAAEQEQITTLSKAVPGGHS
ncbi:hypothetical protein [Streptomyces sp. NBRC 110611]|uniref:hypothetical protein n=1 Tax=Streptomyces sp. NBRC 110611 TaxID=1621259 RepID=UPI0011BD69A0|nr:hypothetical protein [Streptomyces sp. NBRC 110611]